jgi:hypothetical protein
VIYLEVWIYNGCGPGQTAGHEEGADGDEEAEQDVSGYQLQQCNAGRDFMLGRRWEILLGHLVMRNI